MIRNWDYQGLKMDFSSMYSGGNHPSDIDMFYLGANDVLILGEIKNFKGTLGEGQKKLLEALADGWKGEALVLFITHDKEWQKGDRIVNVANCWVQQYYYNRNRKWNKPKLPTTVRDVLEKYRRQYV